MLKKVFQRLSPGQLAAPPKSASAPPAPSPRAAAPKPEGKTDNPVKPAAETRKLKVLFLCIGNSCRSPMALGLARRYGGDVMLAESAGIYPIDRVDPKSILTMEERNIDIKDAFPKGLDAVDAQSFDLIVNMSGERLPGGNIYVEEWNVPDPISKGGEEFRKTADLLEQMVMRLILQLRMRRHPALQKS